MSGIIEMEFGGKRKGWTRVWDVHVPSGISWHRGFPGIQMLDCVADIGTLNFALDNSEQNSAGLFGYYNPDHANCRVGFDINTGVRYRIGDMAYKQAVMEDHPVGYWRLGDAVGSGTVVDSSGNGYTGTVVGGVTLGQTGALADGDTAGLFDGATGKITTWDAGITTGDFSFETWIQQGASATGDRTLLSNYSGGGFIWYISAGASLNCYINGVDVNRSHTFVTGEWYHVVVVRASGDVTLYVNGASLGAAQANAGTLAGGGVYSIGQKTGGGSAMHGSLDEPAIYNYALTATQVANHYAARTASAAYSAIRITGTLSAIDPVLGEWRSQLVQCEAVDWMDVASRAKLSNLPVMVNATGDEVFQALIDSLSPDMQPESVEKDLSNDTYPYTLDRTRDEQTTLRDEFYRLAVSGLDKIRVSGSGVAVYESRTRRAAMITDIDTFTDTHGFIATRNREGVVNRILVTIHPRLPGSTVVVMYALLTPTLLVPGQEIVILGPWTDPDNPDIRVGAVSLETVTVTTDYTANTEPDGSGNDLTASLTVTVGLSGNATEFTISLGGSQSGYITKLQQRGKPLYDYGPTTMQWSNDESIRDYGLTPQPVDMAYQVDPVFAQEVAQYLSYMYSPLRTNVSGLTRFVGFDNAPELARSLARGLSDRIGLTDTATGINRSFFINAIDETELEDTLKTEFMLAPADSTVFWLLEIAGRSELDSTTRLGFGLIIGHTDIVHSDVHGDTVHSDTAHTDTHTDNAHVDVHSDAHGDIAIHDDGAHGDVHIDWANNIAHSDVAHGDVVHSDTHSNVAHADVAHVDTAHTNTHGDIAYQDVAHVDSTTHGDTVHFDVHFDQAHTDSHTDHWDGHNDGYGPEDHTDSYDDIAHVNGHSDVAHVDFSSHTDTHTDVAHYNHHSDVAHGNVLHTDTHTDSHSNVAHSDTAHVNVAYVDSHGDTHTDATGHGDVPHTDTHSDAHTDVAHADVAHADVAHANVEHSDSHSDVAHGDVN